jgi:GrpB-like predicted nucleotidyltransferase (UPF0157 family)
VIEVAPYDPDWPRRFDEEKARLAQLLAPWLEGGIHHIGSTSVPGLAAKPIVDMMAGVGSFEASRAAYEPLLAAGWESTPHRPGIAHHFSKPGFGLHLTEAGSDLWRERLAFRDALRANPELAKEYEALKLSLAREHADEPAAYTKGKRGLVGRALAEAGLTFGRR